MCDNWNKKKAYGDDKTIKNTNVIHYNRKQSAMKQLFFIIGFLGYQTYTHSAINCKNPSGKAVDW